MVHLAAVCGVPVQTCVEDCQQMTPWTNCSLCIPVCTGTLAEEHERTPHHGGIRSVLRRDPLCSAKTCCADASPRLTGPIGTRSSQWTLPGQNWALSCSVPPSGSSCCCSPEMPTQVPFPCGPRPEFAITIGSPPPCKSGAISRESFVFSPCRGQPELSGP